MKESVKMRPLHPFPSPYFLHLSTSYCASHLSLDLQLPPFHALYFHLDFLPLFLIREVGQIKLLIKGHYTLKEYIFPSSTKLNDEKVMGLIPSLNNQIF